MKTKRNRISQNFSLTLHAKERLQERTGIKLGEICNALDDHRDIVIGEDPRKNLTHRLVYTKMTHEFAIAVVDVPQKEVVTVMPVEYSKWVISTKAFSMLKKGA